MPQVKHSSSSGSFLQITNWMYFKQDYVHLFTKYNDWLLLLMYFFLLFLF